MPDKHLQELLKFIEDNETSISDGSKLLNGIIEVLIDVADEDSTAWKDGLTKWADVNKGLMAIADIDATRKSKVNAELMLNIVTKIASFVLAVK